VVDVEADLSLLAVAETGECGLTRVQANEVLDRLDDVVDGQDAVAERCFKTKLLVDLVTTDLREVVALRGEVEVVEEGASSLSGDLLSRTELAVDVAERIFLREDGVLLEGQLDRLEALELLKDVFARQAECLEEHGDR